MDGKTQRSSGGRDPELFWMVNTMGGSRTIGEEGSVVLEIIMGRVAGVVQEGVGFTNGGQLLPILVSTETGTPDGGGCRGVTPRGVFETSGTSDAVFAFGIFLGGVLGRFLSHKRKPWRTKPSINENEKLGLTYGDQFSLSTSHKLPFCSQSILTSFNRTVII